MRAGARPTGSDREVSAQNGRSEHRARRAEAREPRIGRYRLEHCLKRGDRTMVWRASDAGGASAAIKLARRDTSSTHAIVAELEREYELVAALDHAHVVGVREWIEDGDDRAIAFEYLPGGDLVSLAGAAPRHWLKPVRDVARALGYLHGRGLVHRDVKSRNVLLNADGRAELIDFGSCLAIGSPWSVDGTSVEHRPPAWAGCRNRIGDDVYAFAVLLYEMMAGRLPAGPGVERISAPVLHGRADPASQPALADLASRVLGTLTGRPEDCEEKLPEFSSVIELSIATECDPK